MKQQYKKYVMTYFLLSTAMSWAQQEAHYNLYRYHLNLLNPAVVGAAQESFVNLSLRSQWIGVEDAPETQALSLEIPNKGKRLNYGFSLINDHTFVERQTQLFADFSYQLPLSSAGHYLFLGLKAGGTSLRISASDLEVFGSDLADPLLEDTSNFVPNIGMGVYLKTPNYFLSLSVPRILSTERFRFNDGQVTRAADRPHLYAAAGVYKKLSTDWTLSPAFLVTYLAQAPISYTTDVLFTYKRRLDLGVQYSKGFGVGVSAAFQLSPKIEFGYVYMTPTAAQAQLRWGTHEWVMKIRLQTPSTPDLAQLRSNTPPDRS